MVCRMPRESASQLCALVVGYAMVVVRVVGGRGEANAVRRTRRGGLCGVGSREGVVVVFGAVPARMEPSHSQPTV